LDSNVHGIFVGNIKDFFISYPRYRQTLQDIEKKESSSVLFVPRNLDIDDVAFVKQLLSKNGFSKNSIVILEKGASLTLYIDEIFSSLSFYLHELSNLHCVLFIPEARHIAANLHLFLLGKNACAMVNGAYIADGTQTISLQTHQIHLAQDTSSNVIINGIALNNACVKYRGNIHITQQAARANALQSNKTIILGKKALVDSRPNMEVLNNDVQCKHGCAIGILDENQLFYLQTRGIDCSKAKKLMIEGLFAHIYDFDNQELRTRLNKIF